MEKDSKIYIAGHRGMVGSAISRRLKELGYTNLLTLTSKELDLTRQAETEAFFQKEKPEYVFLSAARVGGILANSTYPAEFIYQNLAIAANIIHSSYLSGVKKLLNLGSTCIYPKLAPQPMKEESLLTGPLEPTNEPYAIAKIAAIKLCRYYNQQYGCNFLSAMPANLYGPNDNFNLETSHLLPAFIRKFHLAKLLKNRDFVGIMNDFQKYGTPSKYGNLDMNVEAVTQQMASVGISTDAVTLWGSGQPFRELLYSEDLADACVFLMEKFDAAQIGEFINIGFGKDQPIKEIAQTVKLVVEFKGDIRWDTAKPDGSPKKLSDVTRINELGWKANTALQAGIKLVYENYV